MSGSSSHAEAHVKIQDVTFYRGTRRIYDGLNVAFPRGKITAIMGPSGTGKTTLLRMIGGQLRADKGQVLVDEADVGKMSRSDLFELRKNKMGMLFQTSGLFTDLNVFENVAFPLRVHTNLSEN
ncbi:MAG: ATP-binding cassette domain-containing protein, partial [Thalassolituus sp.]